MSFKFVIVALDVNSETFVIYVTIREQKEMPMHSKRQARIEAQVGTLLFDEAPITVLAEYSNYNNIFSAENAVNLPEITGMNKHAIKLEESKQPPFGPIYSLELVELEMLKTYIEINLANSFIWSS